jgi:tetratricopeptide (TPR) repeat protein
VLNSQYVNGVAYAAHVGGFAVGIAAAMLVKSWLVKKGRVTQMDEHTGFAPRARSMGTPVAERPEPPASEVRQEPVRPRTESERIQRSYVSPRIQTEREGKGFFGIEEAISANISSGQMDVAIEKYREYVRMRHAKPLPAWAQIEIAAELFKLKDYEAALESYRRYLARYPNGADASEAKFRLGIILSRYRKEFFRAREYLLQAVVEHPDREIVKFARDELDRIQAKL